MGFVILLHMGRLDSLENELLCKKQFLIRACPKTSLFSVSDPAVVIATIKPAEDGSGDLVVRLYEATRSSVGCELTTSLPVKQVVETNMLERTLRKLKCKAGQIPLSFRPFEIRTVRIRTEQHNGRNYS